MQFQVGYFIEAIKESLSKAGHDPDKIERLLNYLCHFELETEIDLLVSRNLTTSIIAVANNLLTRGLPTRPSVYLEDVLAKTFLMTQREVDGLGSICYAPSSLYLKSCPLYEALHLIDPRLTPEDFSTSPPSGGEGLGSGHEEDFWLKDIPEQIGNYFVQLLEPQRSLTSIVHLQANFSQQRVDFALEFPYPLGNNRGLIIEIDGSQHDEKTQHYLDRQRDNATRKVGWTTLRIKTADFDVLDFQLASLTKLVENEYFKILANNYQTPLYNTPHGLTALQLTLTPVAIARLQKTLLEFILRGQLDLTATAWQIVVIERDVPCAWLAIEDLKQLLENLFLLEGQGRQLPKINLQVFISREFQPAQLHQLFPNSVKLLEELTEGLKCDLFIDIAMLQRVGLTVGETRIDSQQVAVIRSSHAPSSSATRTFYTTDLIKYRPVVNPPASNMPGIVPEAKQALIYLLQNIFRKEQFRVGQLEILHRALQCQSLIGLLPTGGGKSLTYQLATCLQPGISLVIVPIKSLMKDQYDGLRKNRIDACIVINSSLSGDEKKKATVKLSQAKALFAFISPERLQMQEFRNALQTMYQTGKYFSYCVIDEVHCVSEWGHDFRIAYLKLGENAINFCKTKNLPSIPLMGLTATASFDVLSDVQRELAGPGNNYKLGEEAVIRYGTPLRQELQFEVIKVQTDFEPPGNELPAKTKVGQAKQEILKNLLVTLPDKFSQYQAKYQHSDIAIANFDAQYFFNAECTHAGIIFCPHRSWYFGITDKYKKSRRNQEKVGIYDSLVKPHTAKENESSANSQATVLAKLKIGTFMGSSQADDDIEAESLNHQEAFLNNQLNLLVATKAFGMGIDKPNVRFTVHLNYPSSLESLVQEAGRAGRDGKLAFCYILFSDQKFIKDRGLEEVDEDIPLHFYRVAFKGKEKEKAILYELLSQITYPGSTKMGKGIEIRLAEIQVGEKIIPPIVVAFSNNPKLIIQQISEFFQSLQLSYPGPVERFLRNLQTGKESKVNEYIEDMLANHDQQQGQPINYSVHQLKNLLRKFREKIDTERALFRLATIGVIDDYTVDFRSQTFVLEVTKKEESIYKQYLYRYINTYYSEARAQAEIQKVDAYRGQTTLQRCLGLLIDFVYEEVAKKRLEAIRTMKIACYEGLKVNGNQALQEFIDLYFNSKYARKDYQVEGQNYSLTDRTQEGKNHQIDWVWEFIDVMTVDKSGSQLDNLKHLQGACMRLLVDHPDNACGLLLKAFALFVLEWNNEKLLTEATESFTKGFLIFAETTSLSGPMYVSNILKYQEKLLTYNSSPKLQNTVDTQIRWLLLKRHADWLEQFNHTFLENYATNS
jgi:ATP-dependent DNA helicase RecQ